LAPSDGHDAPWLIDKLVPGLAAVATMLPAVTSLRVRFAHPSLQRLLVRRAWAPRTNVIADRLGSSVKWRSAMAKLDTEDRDELGKESFAFPKDRKEPLENAAHVRNAVARFNQVMGVSDDERDAAWKRIKAAAKKHGVEIKERSWREVGKD
jgi:hypothetical protein